MHPRPRVRETLMIAELLFSGWEACRDSVLPKLHAVMEQQRESRWDIMTFIHFFETRLPLALFPYLAFLRNSMKAPAGEYDLLPNDNGWIWSICHEVVSKFVCQRKNVSPPPLPPPSPCLRPCRPCRLSPHTSHPPKTFASELGPGCVALTRALWAGTHAALQYTSALLTYLDRLFYWHSPGDGKASHGLWKVLNEAQLFVNADKGESYVHVRCPLSAASLGL